MTESDIQRAIQAHVSSLGHRLFRNNTGEGWVGKFGGRTANGSVTLHNARPLHAGLCVGSSDLIGWTDTGRFLAIEVKTETGIISPEQINFIRVAREHGCLAGIARSIDDAKGILSGKI